MPKEMTLKFSQIKIDNRLQMRADLADGFDPEYAAELAEGIMPWTGSKPVVFQHGGVYLLADGRHRYEATRIRNIRDKLAERLWTFTVEVREGRFQDAFDFALRANADHGRKRRPIDKQNAVLAAISDPRWRVWNDAEICHGCKVDSSYIGGVLNNIAESSEGVPGLLRAAVIARAITAYELPLHIATIQGELPQDLQKKWAAMIAEGKIPRLQRNGKSFTVKSIGEVPKAEGPEVPAAAAIKPGIEAMPKWFDRLIELIEMRVLHPVWKVMLKSPKVEKDQFIATLWKDCKNPDPLKKFGETLAIIFPMHAKFDVTTPREELWKSFLKAVEKAKKKKDKDKEEAEEEAPEEETPEVAPAPQGVSVPGWFGKLIAEFARDGFQSWLNDADDEAGATPAQIALRYKIMKQVGYPDDNEAAPELVVDPDEFFDAAHGSYDDTKPLGDNWVATLNMIRLKKRLAAEVAAEDNTDETSSSVSDTSGEPEQIAQAKKYAPDLYRAMELLEEARKLINRAEGGITHIIGRQSWQTKVSDLKAMVVSLRTTSPIAVCPVCEGSGKKNEKVCDCCHAQGWIHATRLTSTGVDIEPKIFPGLEKYDPRKAKAGSEAAE